MATADAELDTGEAAAPVAASATPRAPAPADAKGAKGVKGAKGAKGGKKDAKTKPAKDAAQDGEGGPSIAAHPRAARAVERAKAWGALTGFVLGGYLSLSSHTAAEACIRALVAGGTCYVVFWAAAVFIWRRLVMLELRAREHQMIAQADAGNGSPPKGGAPPGRPERR
jgi:hypothetical protein